MKTVLIFLFIFSFNAFAEQSNQPQMPEKWHTLWKLINEEAKTIEGIGKLSPRMGHRLLELYSEKIKLVRERENKIFFAATPKDRKVLGRKHYFKESANLHKKINTLGSRLLSQFPQYRAKAEVWYTLGLNERDYNQDKNSERYLLQALRHAKKLPALRHNAMTSLAEYYYNGKKYKKCLQYYNAVVNNANDEWRTKHLYNMSWCYIKTNDYAKAIDNLKLTYDLILESSEEKNSHPVRYVDIGTQVLDAIGVFHILDKRPLEARDFFVEKIRDTKEKASTLAAFAKKIADKGFFPEAQEVTLDALNFARKSEHTRLIADIHLFQLDFYRNFKREDFLYSAAQDLLALHKKSPLEDSERDQAVDRIQAFAGWLQERLNKTLYELNDPSEKAERILAYFDILVGINPLKTAWYRYYQGETLYVTKQDSRASKAYQQSFELLRDNKTDDVKEIDQLRRKDMNALLSILARAQLKREEQSSLTEYTYTNHIATWPVDETSRTIYGRLFSFYLENGKRAKADEALTKYVSHYQDDLAIQQDMMASLMDDQIKKKDAPDLSVSIKRLEKGFLNFDKEKINKAVGILGQLLFEKTNKLREQGRPEESLQGLADLSANETYPVIIRRQAAFTQSVVLLELGHGPQSFEWLGKAITLMTLEVKENKQEKKDPFGQFLTQMDAMSNELLLSQDFDTAGKMSEALLNKMCHDKRSEIKIKTSLFNRALDIRLLEQRSTKELFSLAHKCDFKNEFISAQIKQTFRFHLGSSSLEKVVDYWNEHKNELKDGNEEALQLSDLAKRHYWQDQQDSSAREALILADQKDWLSSTDKALDEIAKIAKAQSNFDLPHMTPFDQDIYNQALEKVLNQVQELAARSEPYMQGDSEIVLRAVATMNKIYAAASDAIDNYRPQGVPDDFAAQFQTFMRKLSAPMKAKANQQSAQIRSLVRSGKLMSPNSIRVTHNSEVFSSIEWQHPSEMFAMPMTVPNANSNRSMASINKNNGAEND